jgi:hypothetical protein
MIKRAVLDENALAKIEFDGKTLCYECGQRTQKREDRAPVRSVWGRIIVSGWDKIMSSSASVTASAATISLSEFQTSSPLSSPKTFEIKLIFTLE